MSVFGIKKGIRVLAIAPHSDDIELGCGATLLLLKHKFNVEIYYRVLSTEMRRTLNPNYRLSRKAESQKAAHSLGVKNVYQQAPGEIEYFDAQNFEDTRFPEYRPQIHKYLEFTKSIIDPHIVFAPSPDDMHQDHFTVAETVLRVFREGQNILQYEIHQTNSKPFLPNLFVDVSEVIDWGGDLGKMSFAVRKCQILKNSFPSQQNTIYMDNEVLLGKMRMRGQQCARGFVRYAEAFQARMSICNFQSYQQVFENL
ncbi:MAG: PIG-L deacetylase family protein [Chloroflexota bacterium]